MEERSDGVWSKVFEKTLENHNYTMAYQHYTNNVFSPPPQQPAHVSYYNVIYQKEYQQEPFMNKDKIVPSSSQIVKNVTPPNVMVPAPAPVDLGKGLNKKGQPRKRRRHELPLAERKKLKAELEKEKLCIKPPCSEKCSKKCSSNFSEERRQEIHNDYVALSYEARGIFIHTAVQKLKVKHPKVNTKRPREKSYTYYFADDSGARTEVCKTYFLTTLGYNKKNDTRVLAVLKKSITDQKDGRGKFLKPLKIDRSILRHHIETYNPTVSQYRKGLKPKKLYLPSHINVKMMYQDFKEKFPDVKTSYEFYRHFVKVDMNITFDNPPVVTPKAKTAKPKPQFPH